MNYIDLKIHVDKRFLDDVLAELAAEGFDGVMIDDPEDVKDILDHPDTYRYDYINEEMVANLDRRPVITLYFSDDEEGRAELERAKSAARSALCVADSYTRINGAAVRTEDLVSFAEGEPQDDSEWLYKWQEFFKPTKVGERIVVKPSWEEYSAADDELVIEMDPGMAFGSGLHETTSMCIKALEKALRYESGYSGCEGDNESKRIKVLDVGTGTGILAIAAALLGADECLGIDIDEDAVRVARENIVNNGMADRITAQYGDLTEGVDYRADIVVANLMADLVIRLTPAVSRHLNSGGIYITSGILDIKEEVCREAIEAAGFKVLEVLQDGEWRAIVACLPE